MLYKAPQDGYNDPYDRHTPNKKPPQNKHSVTVGNKRDLCESFGYVFVERNDEPQLAYVAPFAVMGTCGIFRRALNFYKIINS